MEGAGAAGRPEAPWRIGVDVGGTFTDLVLADRRGRMWVAKVPSVPADPSEGVLDALTRVAADLGIERHELLAQCSQLVHGSTIATNTMLEGTGAKVGLVTTDGFRDALEIRRGLRENQWDHRRPFAPVLVPRSLRIGVGGRIDYDGTEHESLSIADVEAAADRFAAADVEAVAVSLLNSFVNDGHETQAAEVIRDRWGGRWVTSSSDISPLMGEYERTSTAVVNASLSPGTIAYLETLEAQLRSQGLPHPILMVQSNGGAASLDQVRSRPVSLLLSGPAAAVGALDHYRRPRRAMMTDLDGDRRYVVRRAVDVRRSGGHQGRLSTIAGYHVSTPAIDIHTIGAGGGTIAGVDSAGMLVVGPEGAGADPGPACYGLGGTEPTVTDAQLVLGRLRAGPYAGGSISLDAEAAHRAIGSRIAEPLGMSVEEAAAGIVTLVEQNLLGAVEYMSIERGHAPRRVHPRGGRRRRSDARRGCRPRAWGRQGLPAAGGGSAVCSWSAEHRSPPGLRSVLSGHRSMTSSRRSSRRPWTSSGSGIGRHARPRASTWTRSELRASSICTIPVRCGRCGCRRPRAGSRQRLRAAFEADYQRLYGHVQEAGTIMIATARVVATAPIGRPGSIRRSAAGHRSRQRARRDP